MNGILGLLLGDRTSQGGNSQGIVGGLGSGLSPTYQPPSQPSTMGVPGFQSGYMQAYGPSNYSTPYTSAVGQTPYTMGGGMGAGGGILDFSSYMQPFQAQRQQWQDSPTQTFNQPQPQQSTPYTGGLLYDSPTLTNMIREDQERKAGLERLANKDSGLSVFARAALENWGNPGGGGGGAMFGGW